MFNLLLDVTDASNDRQHRDVGQSLSPCIGAHSRPKSYTRNHAIWKYISCMMWSQFLITLQLICTTLKKSIFNSFKLRLVKFVKMDMSSNALLSVAAKFNLCKRFREGCSVKTVKVYLVFIFWIWFSWTRLFGAAFYYKLYKQWPSLFGNSVIQQAACTRYLHSSRSWSGACNVYLSSFYRV